MLREPFNIDNNLALIESGIDTASVLEFEYTNAGHKTTSRIVEPLM